MPGCAALACTNSAQKGFLMKRLPRDPVRREQWLNNMKRGYWTPTTYSCLCEIHFAPEMWEKPRVDGKRVLKFNAIPTIFPNPPFKSKKQYSKREKGVLFKEPKLVSDTHLVPVDTLSTSIVKVQPVDDFADSPTNNTSSEKNDVVVEEIYIKQESVY